MPLIDIEGFTCEVKNVRDFPRSPKGTCAFCLGDPLAEYSPPESTIARFYERHPAASTCPCCHGQPT